jgi:ATP-dependent RNA helicase DDX21
MEVMHGDIAQN